MSAPENKDPDTPNGLGGAAHSTPAVPDSVQRILNMLDDLNSSSTGKVLYQHVERMLMEMAQEQGNRDQILRFWLRSLLDVYSKHLSPGSSMHIHVKLLQKQLQLPHTSHELQQLQRHMDLYALHIARMELIDETVLRRALEPVLSYYGEKVDAEPGVAGSKNDQDEASSPKHESQRQVVQNLIEELLPHNDQNTEQKLASKYRQYLSSQHRQAEQVQAKLMRHIRDTINENKQFGDMLENVKLGLAEAAEIDDINLLRESLMEDVEKLGGAYQGLLGKLDEATHYLKMIETDSQQLSEELARVRLLSMTDELTDLPNRRALMRQLEDEMSRSQRYGFQLALALLDLDTFKSVNDKYGHVVGDTVLTCYADRILTTFRHHDMVSRYGGEEFAIILPNTDLEGALAALDKVHKEAAKTICHCGEIDVPAPSFSAGVALLQESDNVESLLKRADDAMYEAKRLGRNQIIVNRQDLLLAQGTDKQSLAADPADAELS